MTGVDVKNPEFGPIRKTLLGTMTFICCRLHAFIGGLYWAKYDYVSTEEGDYTKWLGPDWKPEWTGASTIVSNHVCWMDIVVSLAYFKASFVSKKSVRDMPGIGKIASAIDCLFLDRAATKEEKKKIGQMIEARQVSNE
jgi:1-acyl-sn-glycerol-3-phosphate acyltransferase